MISIIVPCHNYQAYLPQCLESLKRQTVQAAQVIVIDDSSDNPEAIEAIATSFGYQFQAVQFSSPNKTRQLGYSLAQHPYLIFLDADDYLSDNYIEKSIVTLSAGADVAVTDVQCFGNNNEIWLAKPDDKNFCHMGCMVRRDAIHNSNAFFNNEFPTEDYFFWRKLKQSGALFQTTPDALYHYRRHNNSRYAGIYSYWNQCKRLIAVYFATIPDPQRPTTWPKDNIDLVRTWVESTLETNLTPVILSDHPIPNIQSRYPTVINHVMPQTGYGALYKWEAVYEYLKLHHPDKAAFITDISDVKTVINPYKLLTKHHDLWVADEPGTIADSPWLLERLHFTYGAVPPITGKPILNAGLVGGYTDYLKLLSRNIIKDMSRSLSKDSRLTDMAALNKILHETPRVHIGSPLNSIFNKFQTNRDDVCFIHK